MPTRVGYCTDVEGNLNFFRRYVERSGVLRFDDKNELVLEDGCYFVFGGDAVDKGDGDLTLCRLLSRLKRRWPDRVHLLVGNRDLNKLRMTAELSPRTMRELPAADVPKPHWDQKVPTYAEFLATSLKKADDSRANRLRWMLLHTLGCAETFELRRRELGGDASDDAVVDSFVAEVLPGGAVREYLENGCVAARLGTTLFVHGAVDALTAGFVPPLSTEFRLGAVTDPAFPPTKRFFGEDDGAPTRTVDDWVRDLNALLVAGLEDHARRPDFDDVTKSLRRGGEALMALQNRCAVWGRSVVSNCYCDGGNPDSGPAAERRRARWEDAWTKGEALAPTFVEADTGYTSDCRDKAVADWLMAAGVRRVVVGHRPTGDCPAILSACYTGVEMISADTSYSDVEAPDNRGVAVPVVMLEGADLERNRALVSGVLKDGREYTAHMPALGGFVVADDGEDKLLGTEDDQGWWYKAVVDGGAKYLQCRGAGRRVECRDVDRAP